MANVAANASSYAPSRSCCVEIGGAGAASQPASSVRSVPTSSARPSARATVVSASEQRDPTGRRNSAVCASANNAVALADAAAALGQSKSGDVRASISSDMGGALPSSPPAQAVRVSGWLYKSPSRLGPHVSKQIGRVDEEPEAAEDAPSAPSGRSKRLSSAAFLAASKRASSRLLSQSDSIPTPNDKRYFVLNGHDLR